MSDLKDKLIRLGSTKPELREHIRPVLSELGKTAAPEVGLEIRNYNDLSRPIDKALDVSEAEFDPRQGAPIQIGAHPQYGAYMLIWLKYPGQMEWGPFEREVDKIKDSISRVLPAWKFADVDFGMGPGDYSYFSLTYENK